MFTFTAIRTLKPFSSRSESGLLLRACLLLSLLALLFLCAGTFATAQSASLTVLHNFMGGISDGAQPYASLIQDPDSSFYGTTVSGGSANTDYGHQEPGSVFKISPDGSSYAVLHFFPLPATGTTNTDGYSPSNALTLGPDGAYYGVAQRGGQNGLGTVFRITSQGVFSVVHAYDNSDTQNTSAGMDPCSLLLGTDGNFYGAAQSAGANLAGTLYKITPEGTLTTLYTFPASGVNNMTGIFPGAFEGLIQANNGNFYGFAQGGGAYNDGTLFRFTPDGTYTVLHTFSGPDGANPLQVMQASDGDLYGVTQKGGAYDTGTIFKISLDGAFSTLYTFSAVDTLNRNADGDVPDGLIQGRDGNLYGTTFYGGSNGTGTIFQITLAGALTTLYWFSGVADDGSNTDGGFPNGPPTEGADGFLYGTTIEGGTGRFGVVYRLNINLSPAPPHLLLQNPATGQLAAWLLAGQSVAMGSFVNPDQDSKWQAVAEAEFNQDGHSDILFQNSATGQLAVWFMNNTKATGGKLISTIPPAGWKAVSLADFNGDGYPDILLQNQSSGQLAVWLMKGVSALSGQLLATPPSDWKVVGAGDFNSDGKPDILLQNGNTGQLAVWYMNGTSVSGGAYITPIQNPAWKAVAVKDINHDGHPDIVFQNPSTGQVVSWLMNGTAAQDGHVFSPTLPAGWKVVASH